LEERLELLLERLTFFVVDVCCMYHEEGFALCFCFHIGA